MQREESILGRPCTQVNAGEQTSGGWLAANEWRAQGDDFRTFHAEFVSNAQQIALPIGLNW